jgi:phosphoglycolate phosphatase
MHRSGATPLRAVLFDLDGTLIDSFPGIAAAYHQVLNQLDLGDMDDADLMQFIGPPIREVLEKRFLLTGHRLTEGIRIFRQHYGTHGLLQFTKYDDVDDMLETLQSAGLDLYIATSKLTTMAVDVIESAGWTERFKIVGGAEPGDTRYLKKDVIKWTMGQVPSGTAVIAMVGDRDVDITAARSLGLTGIGVTWGYGEASELDRAGAIAIANSTKELLGYLMT